ncbi:MAG: hypothetical protein V1895_00685 [Parcubacteria group bacterium]
MRRSWLVLLVVLGVSGLPLMAVAQTEPDFDDDAYDQLTCLGVSEDEMEDIRDGAVSSPYGPIDMNDSSSRDGGDDKQSTGPFPNGSFQLPFETSGNNQNGFSFTPTYSDEEDERVDGSFYDEPQISLQLSTATAVPGEDVVGTVQYGSFSSGTNVPGSDFYTAVFVDGIYVNGYMAGGSAEALEQLRVSAGDPSRPDCGAIRREVGSDADGDGMDDAWEIRYGLNPSNPADAGQDPDKDGFVADTLLNLKGEPVVPAPPIAGAELGDGQFTNYEEFVLDTDPTKADTDGDGFSDEQDAVGYGQTTVRFPARKQVGQGAYQVHLIVTGRTGKLNEDGLALTKIDSAFKEVQVGTRENLEVSLKVVEGARPGGTLRVEAQPSGTAQRDLLNTYRWSVNGELVTLSSGQGRRTLEYPVAPETQSGTELNVALDLINEQTGQLARGRVTVIVGDTILLDYDPDSVESGGQVTVQALLTAGQAPEDFLFAWEVDGAEQTLQSGLGKSQLAFTVTAAPGLTQTLAVTVYRAKGSSKVGTLEHTLTVLEPLVTLEITPDPLPAGQVGLARAVADHFAATTLVYQFELDGTPLASTGSTAEIKTLSEGTHEISATVTSPGPQAQSALARQTFEVLPGSVAILAAGEPGAISAMLARTAGVGTTIGVLALAGLVLRRRTLKVQAV